MTVYFSLLLLVVLGVYFLKGDSINITQSIIIMVHAREPSACRRGRPADLNQPSGSSPAGCCCGDRFGVMSINLWRDRIKDFCKVADMMDFDIECKV
ncbi:hypothetical protein BJY00DRAFT_52121 [Aspergillus carlsbadensis]|nr:hypothetical protein BJY00DRAFT_52121 [Aspergillus carlsbadensis]